jgi:hypothetical protein
MSDGIKKVTVKKSSLPPVNELNQHYIRFRVVSDDKNRVSHWSPLYKLKAKDIQESFGSVTISDNIAFVVWEDFGQNPEYDVFLIDVDESEQEQEATLIETTTRKNSVILLLEKVKIKILIQRASINKDVQQNLTVYKSDTIVL